MFKITLNIHPSHIVAKDYIEIQGENFMFNIPVDVSTVEKGHVVINDNKVKIKILSPNIGIKGDWERYRIELNEHIVRYKS